MQEFRQNPQPSPGPRLRAQPVPEPRATRARQAAAGALAAADAAIGVGGSAVNGAVGVARSVFRLGRPLLDSVVSPLTSTARTAAPLADLTGQAWPRPWLRQVTERGRQDREALTSAAFGLVLGRVPWLTTAVLNQLDLTAVVAERVDVNAVAAQVDVDAIARRVDVIAILDRVDPAALTRYLVEELDLPAIIQSSTGTIMSDTVHDVRMQSISADERLSRLVDAMLLRRNPRRTAAPGTAEGGGPAGSAGAGPVPPPEATRPAASTGTTDGTLRAAT